MTAPNDVPNAADVSDAVQARWEMHAEWLGDLADDIAGGAVLRRELDAGVLRDIANDIRCDRAALLAQRAADAGEIARLRAENARLRAAILWADGQGDEFRPRTEGRGPYWWRRELMERAGLAEEAVLPRPAYRYPVLSAEDAAAQVVRRNATEAP